MPDGALATSPALVSATGIAMRYGRRTVLENVATTRMARVPDGASLIPNRVSGAPGIRIGYTPQTLVIDRSLPLSVRRFLRMAGPNDAATLAAALDGVGAGDTLEREVRLLSGGELKRVMLARALLRNPDLLVLDEPTANVDVHGQTDFYELIARIRDDRGCGVLLVSHDLHLVMSATDRVLCLNGHICCSGLPEDVSKHPAYLELFGETAAAVAVYSHSHDHHHA